MEWTPGMPSFELLSGGGDNLFELNMECSRRLTSWDGEEIKRKSDCKRDVFQGLA
jgi:hypothetical protein